MPFAITDVLQKCNTPFLSAGATKLFHSVWYTAGILTVLIIILVMVIYPGKSGTPVWVLGKLGLYVFLISASVVFIHGCIVRNEYSEKISGNENNAFIERLGGDTHLAFADGNIKINPAIHEPYTIEPTMPSTPTHEIAGGSENLFAMYGV